MILRPPTSTLTDTLVPYTTLCRSILVVAEVDLDGRWRPLLSTVLIAAGAVGLWIGLRRSLQLLGMFVSLFAVLSARSEEHTSELQSLMRLSYVVLCLKNKTTKANDT